MSQPNFYSIVAPTMLLTHFVHMINNANILKNQVDWSSRLKVMKQRVIKFEKKFGQNDENF